VVKKRQESNSASHKNWGDLWPTDSSSALIGLWIAAMRSVPILSLLLFCWSAAVLLLRLLAPRPPRRYLWCQPGFLACVAAVFVFAWKLVSLGALIAAELVTSGRAWPSSLSYGDVVRELTVILLTSRGNVGGSVLLVWLVAWASGRCRPEPSWVDRAGRVLGAVWICVSLLEVSRGML
jgi:hypothetical protein